MRAQTQSPGGAGLPFPQGKKEGKEEVGVGRGGGEGEDAGKGGRELRGWAVRFAGVKNVDVEGVSIPALN